MFFVFKSLRCLFGFHGHTYRDRSGLICEACGSVVPILESELVLDGPAHRPGEVRGAPVNTKVKTKAERSKTLAFRYERRG